jgi:ribosomal protein L12E/L44/L45/RPP1/RPP2
MKSLFASLLAAVFVISALAVHAATIPVAGKAVFTADAGSMPADEDTDKDKDKDKDKDEKKDG